MDGLEVGELIADVRGRAEPESSYRRGAKIAQEVAQEVLGDDHVEPPRIHYQGVRSGVGVDQVGLDVRVVGRDLEEHDPEEREAAQDVALVDAGHAPNAVQRRPISMTRELERVADDALHPRPRDHQDVGCRPPGHRTNTLEASRPSVFSRTIA